MIIVIDGPAGTGKSTVARTLAQRLGFTFFDTGAMYRSVAWMAIQAGEDPGNREALIRLLPHFTYEVKTDSNGGKRYFACGTDVTTAIRTPGISEAASRVAVHPEVRRALVQIQRDFGKKASAVFEGRDMGTVVFPDADLKIFLTATAYERAVRRYRELQSKFPDIADSLQFDQILREIESRDSNDSMRAESPLRQAHDARCIDTSKLSAEEVVEAILQLVPKKKYPPMKFSYWMVYWIARFFFKLCFRLKVYGLENFRPGCGIIAANHASNFDPPVLSVSCPEEVHFLAKESLFRIPVLGAMIRCLNSHPVARSASDASTFREVLKILQSGEKVILFPEGKRTPDGAIQPLERGIAFIMQKSQCPIFPAFIEGTFSLWPIRKKFPKLFGKIKVSFGAPIEWSDFAALNKKEAEKLILERVETSLRELEEKVKNMRPR